MKFFIELINNRKKYFNYFCYLKGMLLIILEVISILSIIFYYLMNIYITYRSEAIKDKIVKYAFEKYWQDNKNWLYIKYKRCKNFFKTYTGWFLNTKKDIILVDFPEIEMKSINTENKLTFVEFNDKSAFEFVENPFERIVDWVKIN